MRTHNDDDDAPEVPSNVSQHPVIDESTRRIITTACDGDGPSLGSHFSPAYFYLTSIMGRPSDQHTMALGRALTRDQLRTYFIIDYRLIE